MGLFNRKAKATQELKKIENNEFTPLDTFNLQNNIAAQEAVIDSQVGDTSILNDIQWNRWIHINLQCDYYANRFKYEAKDYKHNFIINRALRNGFIYGVCGVWNNNGTPEIVQIADYRNDEVRITVITDDTKEFRKDANTTFIWVKRDTVIEYQFSSLGYSAFLTLGPLLKLEQLVQKVLYNETLTNATRIIRDVDAGSSKKTAQQFVKFLSPLINRYNNGKDRYEGLALDTNTEKAIEVIEYAKNWYYDILGRRTNSDFKKTHSLNSEIEAGQFNGEVLERDRYMFLKKFLRDYSKMFNVKINLENETGEMVDVFEQIYGKRVENETETSNTK